MKATIARLRLPRSESPLPVAYFLVTSATIVLVVLGVIMVQSSTAVTALTTGNSLLTGLKRQGLFALIGGITMVVLSRTPQHIVKKYAWVALAAGLFLQLLVYSPLGYEAGGNRNWIRIGPISGQPAELMKFVLVIWIATILSNKERLISSWKHALIPVVPVVILSIFINIVGGDLGTILVIVCLLFGALYFAQIKTRILLGLSVFFAAGVAVMTVIKPNRVMRVIHYLETDCVTDVESYHGLCWQPLHGLWAMSHGGVFGVGVGNSIAKWSWLPAADNDYIFAIIAEELGLIGALFTLGVFVLLIFAMVWALRKSRDLFSTVVLGAAMVWIASQMIVNISVVLGFIPVLGVPLPFVSSGGTSLLAAMAMMGVVLSCIRNNARADDDFSMGSGVPLR
ncbi:putative peptidoglycan glycosyltransferase FtsW [Lysinibacter sp. HNR]|uniref:peptidoglycan glycosyltransferase FtsW n=1 Tax=Lysinibacter sp. HNR TaxID=3031408 RepID=UPI002435F578|nr:putative peptidoglycan glycosyltransferase FtsW [Lysinibacter sp. HNR]WGD37062.1 putative peptidoglycan glycosyltransferase FtsW [Lysinibacter sp. HNR]